MRLQSPLDDLFHSRSHVRLLRASSELLEGMPASGRELARRAGVAHGTASRILDELSQQGIVVSRRYGRADMHQLNTEHILYPLIREMFAREQQVPERLQTLLREELQRIGRISDAYLFGSAARGDMTTSSDIDVAVIVPKSAEREIEAPLEHLSERVRKAFGSELSVLVGDRPPRKGRGRGAWRRIPQEGIAIFPPRQGKRAAR
jgi:predicted nucleotidyltransferase